MSSNACFRWTSLAIASMNPLLLRQTGETRWDELYTAHSATTMNENGSRRQYAVLRRVVQRSSALLVLESPWMSLTRDALWHNGL